VKETRTKGVFHAGHYYSQGHHSSLRFNEINTNGQCTRCNCFLHGNLINYRQGLLKRYGQQKLDLLESAARHKVKKWSATELEIIIQQYKTQAP
jgi:SET domain-containing protein